MFKKTMTAMGLALIVATPVAAVEGPFPVREIDAHTDFLNANTTALEFYPEVMTDIENAVRARVDMADEDDVRDVGIDVILTSMRVNDTPGLTDDGEFNTLEGSIAVFDQDGQPPVYVQQVLLEATELDLPGPTIGPDDEDFYTAMVLAFVDKVAEAVAEVDDLPEIEETLR